jgi:OOP family OmpA-OmpF porin
MKQVKRRINLRSDAYFEFDSATLTQDGKDKLDRIARQLRDAQEPSIRIVGHTDRIGPEDYNMKLSRDRAQAVKNYLTRQGVPERVMNVAGRGEAEPIERCEGMRGNALVDCLQPNRRTDIEFSAFEVVEEPVR